MSSCRNKRSYRSFYVDGAGAEARRTGVEAVEIYPTLQRILEISRIVEAGRLDRPRRLKPWSPSACFEKSSCSVRERKAGAHLIDKISPNVAFGEPKASIAKG